MGEFFALRAYETYRGSMLKEAALKGLRTTDRYQIHPRSLPMKGVMTIAAFEDHPGEVQ